MREFIYASYLRITPEEFFDLAAKEMSKLMNLINLVQKIIKILSFNFGSI